MASLIQNRTDIHGSGFQFKFISGHSIQLKGPHKLTQPLLKPIKKSLRDSIHKKLQIAMTIDWKSWTRRRILMKAEWKRSDRNISNEYQEILDGALPKRRDGLKVTGRFDWTTKKSKGIQINLFDLYQFSRLEEKTDLVAVSVNARGDILLEQKSALEKRRISGRNLELYRIITRHNDKPGKDKVTWSFEKKDRFSRDSVKKLLTAILRVRSIAEYDLPGQYYFPADLNLIWMTDFSHTALQEVKQTSDEEVWRAIIQAFQLFEDRYGRLNEDWINSECWRERIKNDPIGAVLESKYPIPGRTKEERQIVVSQYRSVLGFLSLIEKWKNGLEIDIRDFVSNSFELPVFAFFHILSAPETRKSAVLIVGDFQRGWGDQQLIGV